MATTEELEERIINLEGRILAIEDTLQDITKDDLKQSKKLMKEFDKFDINKIKVLSSENGRMALRIKETQDGNP